MTVVYASAFMLVAAPVSAGCIDFGIEVFANSMVAIRLCIGSTCEPAFRTRSCVDVRYSSEDYSATSMTWRFGYREHDLEQVADNEYFILRNTINPESRPSGVVNGQNLWSLGNGLPLAADQLQQITCVPVSGPDACDFIDQVLLNLRHR